MFNPNGFFVEYSGWFILFAVVVVGIGFILMIAGSETNTDSAWWIGTVLTTVALIALGCSIIGYVKNGQHDKQVKWETRNCREVNAQKIDSFVDGTPVVIDDIYGTDTTVCER